MRREVKGIEETLEVLAKMKVAWTTVNRIQNNMGDTRVEFSGSNHHRVAYFDETQNVLLLN